MSLPLVRRIAGSLALLLACRLCAGVACGPRTLLRLVGRPMALALPAAGCCGLGRARLAASSLARLRPLRRCTRLGSKQLLLKRLESGRRIGNEAWHRLSQCRGSRRDAQQVIWAKVPVSGCSPADRAIWPHQRARRLCRQAVPHASPPSSWCALGRGRMRCCRECASA